jgi:PhnB protein
MNVHPYLNFDGHTEQAMRLYARALGGTLGEIHRFGAMPASGFELTDEQKQRVMHVTLELPGGARIMASDTLPGMGAPWAAGNAYSISVHPDSREQADQIFAALSEGGTVTFPLADQFWGDYYGTLVDAFGVSWMINFHASA